jgi:hypothetical protein
MPKTDKIDYVKPEILDLGPVTQAAVGAAECPPGNIASGLCETGGTAGACPLTGIGGGPY